jgi:hypothetical protein
VRDDLQSAVRLVAAGASYGEAARAKRLTRNAVAGACWRAGVKTAREKRSEQNRRACSSAMKDYWRRYREHRARKGLPP